MKEPHEIRTQLMKDIKQVPELEQKNNHGAYLVCWTSKLTNGGFHDDYKPFSTYKKAAAFYAQIINYSATWTAHMTRTLQSTDYDTSA